MKIVIPYTKKTTAIGSALLILIIASGIILIWQPSRPSSTITATTMFPPFVETEREGDVQVDVVHDSVSTPTTHQFTLTLDTHSGDLSTFDAQMNVTYKTEGEKEILPQSIGGDRETHHRTIITTFANATLPGTILVKNLRGVPERSFSFTQ